MPSGTRTDAAAWLWVAVLATASLALSRAFACATPFAALATFGALTLRPRQGAVLVMSAWLGNQVIGFGLLHYPCTPPTLGWGLAIGVAVLAALAAATLAGRSRASMIGAWGGAFLAAFAAYELTLRTAGFALPFGPAAFSAATVGRLFVVNGAALGLLVAADALTLRAGLRLRAAPAGL